MVNNFQNSDSYKNIFLFHDTIPDRLESRESSGLEFKESFNWDNKSHYAKSIAAFANNKGGYIIFGVKDNPHDLVGLQNDNFEKADEAKITEYLNNAFSPEIIFKKFVITVKTKKVGLLFVEQTKTKPVICLKNNQKIKEADIYYRYNARSEKIKYPELKEMFDSVKEKEQKSWMELFEKISKIGPTNAAILDTVSGKITGSGGTLVIDKKLVPKLKFITQGNFQENGEPVLKLIGDVKPVVIVTGKNKNGLGVQITDNPNAPVVRLEEEEILSKKYLLDYNGLVQDLSKRYSNFKRNKKFHKLRNELMKDENLCIIRYLDPNNHKGSKKAFYSPKIVAKFDQHYTLKSPMIDPRESST